MFDPAQIHRDMEAIFPGGPWPSGDVPRDRWPLQGAAADANAPAGSPSRRGVRALILSPLPIAAILLGFVGGSIFGDVGVGRSIRSVFAGRSVSNPVPVRQQEQVVPKAMVALPLASASEEPPPTVQRPATGKRQGWHYVNARRYRWARNHWRSTVSRRKGDALQRALEEDAAVTRQLNARSLGARPSLPLLPVDGER